MTDTAAARLVWDGRRRSAGATAHRTDGSGCAFEVQTVTIRGYDQQVFANQPPTLRAMFEGTIARACPTPLFIVDGDRRWSMTEALADIDAIARHLRDRYGVTPGDRVAIVAANSPEYLLTMWATVTIGGIVAGLNGWWTGPEIDHGMALAAPKVLVGDEKRLAGSSPCPRVCRC